MKIEIKCHFYGEFSVFFYVNFKWQLNMEISDNFSSGSVALGLVELSNDSLTIKPQI